ncbi:MAG: hypothetical protein F6J95_010550 [Leptolyngbya sp. SIO1E4]|nr:hypothetical protein [Leptolyngbya sp. SIO1E4]
MNEAAFHACPICASSTPHTARYPQSVCHACYEKACDERDRKLTFSNVSLSGGFQAIVTDTQAEYLSHICYIDGVQCWADEARFGGIVIEPYSSR